jgi:hypothetical protein
VIEDFRFFNIKENVLTVVTIIKRVGMH